AVGLGLAQPHRLEHRLGAVGQPPLLEQERAERPAAEPQEVRPDDHRGSPPAVTRRRPRHLTARTTVARGPAGSAVRPARPRGARSARVHSRRMESAKSMKLYDRVERIHNELRALGIADDAPLTVEQLVPFDQYHYHGTEAVDEAARRLGVGPATRVLDVGAG